MVGAHIFNARGKHPCHPKGSLDSLLRCGFAPAGQVLIHSAPDQVCNGFAGCGGKAPESPDLALRQLDLCTYHRFNIMITILTSCCGQTGTLAPESEKLPLSP